MKIGGGFMVKLMNQTMNIRQERHSVSTRNPAVNHVTKNQNKQELSERWYEAQYLTNKKITDKLKYQVKETEDKSLVVPYSKKQWRRASVLVPFTKISGEWHLLFIRRAELEGDRHSGQVAFPGGKHEEGDANETYTALREAEEEIGLAMKDVIVLGQLNDHYSGVSSFQITPVVAEMVWPYSFTLQQAEVARVFTIPLKWLANTENYSVKYHTHSEKSEPMAVIYFKQYKGELLWGATARMVLSLLECLQVR